CWRFDDFLSQFIEIDNSIGQGCLLSMLIYILYNADLLDIPRNKEKEDAIGYVDDATLVAIGNSFEETTKTISKMMEHPGGAFKWSTNHNSRFEISKLVVMHCSRKLTTTDDTSR
ncbi:hypothetical protein FA15DRAFT_599966, partial [Coprinopsis marcescibilis]